MAKRFRFTALVLVAFLFLPVLASAQSEMSPDDTIVVRYFSGKDLAKTLTVKPNGEAVWDVKDAALASKIDAARAFLVHGKRETPIGGDSFGRVYATEFRFGPGDTLDINVWDNAQISKLVTVRPDGMITLPLVGDIRVGGLSAEELKTYLYKELQRFVEKPVITVTVTQINSYQVFVQGQVTRPGAYAITGSSTITQAISLAGGFTQFADRNGIIILRNSLTKTEKIQVKYKKIVAGKIPDVRVEPGDTIIVP
jgi:polysaccharide biosynthesis/export protein